MKGKDRVTGSGKGPRALAIDVGEGRRAVRLEALRQGPDWLLRITGGDDHVGAVAIAHGSEVHLHVIGPHKEGPLAEEGARRWSALTGSVCVAAAGIHQDDITREEIAAIVANVDRGLTALMEQWKESRL